MRFRVSEFGQTVFKILVLASTLTYAISCRYEKIPETSIIQGTTEREIFAPGIISLPDRHEFGSVFTPDGKEIFIAIEHGKWASIVSYKYDKNKWHGPNPVIGGPELSANDPMLSPDGKRLYFISSRSGQYDIGYIERLGNESWGPPNWAPFPINSHANEYYISFTRENDLIFATERDAKQAGDFDIVRARKVSNGEYSLEVFPDTINTSGYEADAFIDPEGLYLIFSSDRPQGLGRGDLYISFAEKQGTWTPAISLGDAVNTAGHELCPYVSPDGQWLYFTSGGDIYRISTDIIANVKSAATNQTNSSIKAKQNPVEDYISVNTETVLLTNATLHIGDGSKAKRRQSVLIEGKYIVRVGPDNTFDFPKSTRIIDVGGASVLPGLVGMHNHTHMPGKPLLKHMAPRLYLASGVTTMTTAGSADTLGELEMVASIRSGDIPGPTIFPSAHYITGPAGNGSMTKLGSVEEAKAFVREWAGQGVTWFKLYRHTEPPIAAAVIEEAHAQGLKVTGHLCSITYGEAAVMGIDSIEHGLNAATDFVTDKKLGECVASRASKTVLKPESQALKTLIKTLIDNDVTLTSTLAILETGFPHRPQADARSLSLMNGAQRAAYEARQKRLEASANTTTSTTSFWSLLLAFERNFVEEGGHLVAGPDTGRHIFPGYGDQRNFELLVEAGFLVDETIKIMTSNGAETLGIADKTGLIKQGYEADLIILGGSLYDDPANIRATKFVFKDGTGYDPDALILSVKKHIHTE